MRMCLELKYWVEVINIAQGSGNLGLILNVYTKLHRILFTLLLLHYLHFDTNVQLTVSHGLMCVLAADRLESIDHLAQFQSIYHLEGCVEVCRNI